jgi:hypothetical protein
MKCLTLAILGSTITMFAVLLLLDLYQIFVTPLSPLGINHWIPEAFTLFFIGRYLTRRINKTLLPVIVGCVFLFPVLSYALVGQLTFGLGTSCIFVAVLIMGVWS